MRFSYDAAVDVMYVTLEERPMDSYLYMENLAGDVLKIDRTDHRVVGFTLLGFMQRATADVVEIPEVGCAG